MSACLRLFAHPRVSPVEQLGNAFSEASRYVGHRPGSRHLVPATSGSAAWCRRRRLPFREPSPVLASRLVSAYEAIEAPGSLLQDPLDLEQLGGGSIVGRGADAFC